MVAAYRSVSSAVDMLHRAVRTPCVGSRGSCCLVPRQIQEALCSLACSMLRCRPSVCRSSRRTSRMISGAATSAHRASSQRIAAPSPRSDSPIAGRTFLSECMPYSIAPDFRIHHRPFVNAICRQIRLMMKTKYRCKKGNNALNSSSSKQFQP